MTYVICQLIGLCGIGVNFAIYQQTDRKRLLLTKLLSDIIWAIHYLSLGAFSATAVACIGLLREITFYICFRKHCQKKAILILFMLISLTAGMITWNGVKSLLPVLASCTAIFSFWQSKPSATHKLSIVVSVFMLTYDIAVMSVAGIINELLTMTSAISTIIRSGKT